MEGFAGMLTDKKKAEAGLKGMTDLLNSGGKDAVVNMIPHLPAVLECAAAKEKPTASAAETAARLCFENAEYISFLSIDFSYNLLLLTS